MDSAPRSARRRDDDSPVIAKAVAGFLLAIVAILFAAMIATIARAAPLGAASGAGATQRVAVVEVFVP